MSVPVFEFNAIRNRRKFQVFTLVSCVSEILEETVAIKSEKVCKVSLTANYERSQVTQHQVHGLNSHLPTIATCPACI